MSSKCLMSARIGLILVALTGSVKANDIFSLECSVTSKSNASAQTRSPAPPSRQEIYYFTIDLNTKQAFRFESNNYFKNISFDNGMITIIDDGSNHISINRTSGQFIGYINLQNGFKLFEEGACKRIGYMPAPTPKF